jgi:uncharacterized membrane protein (DUF4010 family)
MGELHDILLSVLIAFAIGLLIGIERGWSDREEIEGSRFAGIRTFSIVGLLGGIMGLLTQHTDPWVLAVSFAGVTALVIVAHLLDVRKNRDIGTTTAFAMLLTFALAAWSVFGYELPALGTTVLVMALLGYKPVLHRWLQRLEQIEIYAIIKLLVISIVLLPLLPNEGFGPWDAFNPYWVWWMVVLISGLSFAGYIAIKVAGKDLGTLVTSFTGGMVSSTATTLSLAQFAKETFHKHLFMAGVILASSIMFIRVAIEVIIVNYELLAYVWIPLSLMFAGLIAAGLWLWYVRIDHKQQAAEINLKNPFQLSTAIQFGLILGAILILAEAMLDWFGEEGIYALSIISGLMDVDAITLSLSRMAAEGLRSEVAAMGIVLASATNTVIKGVIFAFFAGLKESLILILLLIISMIPGLAASYVLLLM